MTADQLFDTNHSQSWNYQNRWIVTISANELVLGEVLDNHEEGACIPARYALALLVDHFGPDKVKQHIDDLTQLP
jgi:hypothetical protein